jgi:hypothetical protein
MHKLRALASSSSLPTSVGASVLYTRAGPAKSEAKWLPVQLVDRTLLLCPQHPPGALGERQQSGTPASGTAGVLQDPPAAFAGVEVGPTMGREDRAATRLGGGGAWGVELGRPVAPAASADPPALWAGFAAGRHDWGQIWSPLLGSTGRHTLIAALGGVIRARPQDAEPHPAGAPAPGALAEPRRALEGCGAVALTLAQRAYGEAPARGRAKRQRSVASSESNMSSPRRAWDARAARSREPSARAAGARGDPGADRSVRALFEDTAPTRTTAWDAGLVGPRRGECAATARRVDGARREGGLSTEAMEGLVASPGHCRGRPARGRSTTPAPPGVATREPHGRRAEAVTERASETGGQRGPGPPGRPAWARRKTRAAWSCGKQGAQGGSASSGKGSLRGRIGESPAIKYASTMTLRRHTR